MKHFFSQNTALHFACAGGHLAAVELLIDQRADVTIKNTHDATPLDLAIDNLHLETATCMLRSRKCALTFCDVTSIVCVEYVVIVVV